MTALTSSIAPEPHTGSLPRAIASDFLWTGSCLHAEYNGSIVHGHFSTHLVVGSEKTILVDSGHPIAWPTLEGEIEQFLDGRPLDYLFATHGEFPHAGLLPNWLRKYPNCIALGALPDYRYFYPDFAHRIRVVAAGDRIDLGDREFIFLPAIWRDLNSTLWGFETRHRTLFVSDAFAYLHYHEDGQCDFMSSEHPAPDIKLLQFFNERALQWTKFQDPRRTYADIDKIFTMFRPRLIAPGHGGMIDTVEEMLELSKRGMLIGEPEATAGHVHDPAMSYSASAPEPTP